MPDRLTDTDLNADVFIYGGVFNNVKREVNLLLVQQGDASY